MIHDFAESLEKSNRQADAPWWSIVYRKAFGPLATMASVRQDGWAQRAGIDRSITLPCGRVIEVDEKVREKDWNDFCLEYLSDRDRGIPGWVCKPLKCEFIAYAFVETERCFLLPTLSLQAAWRAHAGEWIASHRKVEAQNRGYVTVSVAVPIKDRSWRCCASDARLMG